MADPNLTPEEMNKRFIESFGIPIGFMQTDDTAYIRPVMIQLAEQPFNITFLNRDEGKVGQLTIENDQLVFTGNADEAARVFFDYLKTMIDGYIAGRLKGE